MVPWIVLRLRRAQSIGAPEALLLAVGLLVVPVVLLLAEAGLALAQAGEDPDQKSSSIDRLHRYSEVFGWEPRPGRYVDDDRLVTINAQGYRGEPIAPRSGVRRVLILGDSVAFGLYVNDHETYAAQLGALADDLEVANLAVQGYGPEQSLLRLERVGLEMDPDLVVFGLCLGNDFADVMLDSFLYDAAHPKPYFRIQAGQLVRHDEHLRLGSRRRLALWLHDNSRLFRTVLGSQAGETPVRVWSGRRREAMRDRAAAIALVARLAAEMRELAAARGAAFLVALHPDRLDVGHRREKWNGALLRALAAEDVEALELEAEYANRGLGYEDVSIDAIGHLSPRGHALTARILETRLRQLSRAGASSLAVSGDTPSLPLR